jgi:hypothetical protein
VSTRRWEAALDAFASCLVEQERLLEQATVDALPQFEPAPGLGPLPPSLKPRASDLLARSVALSCDVESRAAAARRQLALTRRMAMAEGTAAVYLDRRA